jgi:hypothetical protein
VVTDSEFEAIWGTQRAELQRDLVGIWMLVGAVNRVMPGLADADVRDLVLDVMERVLREGEAEAAHGPYGGDLERWVAPPEEIRSRVEREWIALGRNPHPGEIVWLQKVGGWLARSPATVAANRESTARIRRRLQGGRTWQTWWTERGRDELGELLWQRWDPIGFASPSGHFKPPRDEYMGYVDELGRLLRDGASAADVEAFLSEVVRVRLRLDPELDAAAVGHELVAWHAKATG